MERKTDCGNDNTHYLVLNTRTLRQRQLANVLSDRFPPERGRIFIPEREFWMRKTKEIMRKPMFPGYVFALTDMSQAELYAFAHENGADIQTFIKELSVKERALNKETIEEDSEFWTELTEEESEFIDKMLDDEGIERMSVGYSEGNHYVIMEGPLKGWEKHIASSDRHNREAYLNISFRRHRVIAGLELKPKSTFFHNGKQTTEVLEDGTEIDMDELSRRMMGSSIRT